jgi:hypothetical protein
MHLARERDRDSFIKSIELTMTHRGVSIWVTNWKNISIGRKFNSNWAEMFVQKLLLLQNCFSSRRSYCQYFQLAILSLSLTKQLCVENAIIISCHHPHWLTSVSYSLLFNLTDSHGQLKTLICIELLLLSRIFFDELSMEIGNLLKLIFSAGACKIFDLFMSLTKMFPLIFQEMKFTSN